MEYLSHHLSDLMEQTESIENELTVKQNSIAVLKERILKMKEVKLL